MNYLVGDFYAAIHTRFAFGKIVLLGSAIGAKSIVFRLRRWINAADFTNHFVLLKEPPLRKSASQSRCAGKGLT